MRADQECQAGNYRGAVALLLSLLQGKDKLSPWQELNAVTCLIHCNIPMLDYKVALPYAERKLALAQQLMGPRSQGHAQALKALCMVQRGLKAYRAARKAIREGLAILEELGLQQDEDYGGMLVSLGKVEQEQAHYKEALTVYSKAKDVLVQHKDCSDFGVLINEMAICHEALHQWNEAVALRKEVIEHHRKKFGKKHPEYAVVLNNLGVLFYSLKQYEEAIPHFEEVLAIRRRVFGAQHELTIQVSEDLALNRRLAQQPNRHLLDAGHDFSMCNACGTVKEHMFKCDGCNRARYCDADCQLKHWPTHKPQCDVCLQCATVLTKILHCSGCKKVKYCGAACQTAHWSEHKKDCVAPPMK
jgi:tetratricopeptide (TPR) repeat protein